MDNEETKQLVEDPSLYSDAIIYKYLDHLKRSHFIINLKKFKKDKEYKRKTLIHLAQYMYLKIITKYAPIQAVPQRYFELLRRVLLKDLFTCYCR